MQQAGTPRILFAAFCSAIGKLFKKRGIFYAIAGEAVRAIDGPCPGALPPMDRCVTLGPEKKKTVKKGRLLRTRFEGRAKMVTKLLSIENWGFPVAEKKPGVGGV